MVMLGHLVEQLFGKAGFAASGRANEQVKAGQDAVEGAIKIGEAGLPTADLFYLALPLKRARVLMRSSLRLSLTVKKIPG